MTDATGTIRARYDYDPYGNVTKLSGNLDTDFAYTGHYYHAASGLHLAPYRGYDPRLGRWLSRDPIAEMGGINLYEYVGGHPLSAIDRDGRFWAWLGKKVVAFAVGFAAGAAGEGWKQLCSGQYDNAGFDKDSIVSSGLIGGAVAVVVVSSVEAAVVTSAIIMIEKMGEGLIEYCLKKRRDPSWPYPKTPPFAPFPIAPPFSPIP